MMNLQKINKLFLISILFIFCIILNLSNTLAQENIIVFKIKDKAFTSLDIELREKYLNFVGSNRGLDKETVINDFISVNLFFEYFKDLEDNNNYNKKINEIYTNIKTINEENKKTFNYEINEENILYNIRLDFIRKIVLERLFNSNFKELNQSKNEIDLLYDFKIRYINFNIEKNIEVREIINSLKDIKLDTVLSLLKNNKVNFFIKEEEINNINKVDKQIVSNILSNNNFFIIEKNNNVSLIFIEKKFATMDGIIGNLYSFKSKENIQRENLYCKNLKNQKNNPNIINKEYEYSKLNDKLRENLININDYIKLNNNNNENVYIILCDIKFDKKILSSVNLNKLINSNVSEIEKRFINKFSIIYNLEVVND